MNVLVNSHELKLTRVLFPGFLGCLNGVSSVKCGPEYSSLTRIFFCLKTSPLNLVRFPKLLNVPKHPVSVDKTLLYEEGQRFN